MNCDYTRDNVELYVFGELDFDAEEQIESHAATCPHCQTLIDEHRAILRMMNEVEVDPPPALLQQCRQDLKRTLRAEGEIPTTFLGRLAWLTAGWPRLWKPALGVAALACAFYAGQWNEERKTIAAAGMPTARIRTIQGTGNGMVQIVLEEPRQRMIEGGLHEASIEQALLAAARQSPDPGMRLESVDLLRNRCNRDDVRRTILQTLENDDSPVVRQRALEALRPHASESEVRQVLARVLVKDTNPNVRAQAIDLLVSRPSADFVGTLQDVIRREENDYVRDRCLRILSEMRASPGVF